MLLNLSKIIHVPGASVPFDFSLDFSDMDFGGSFPAQKPVAASGSVRNEAGVLLLEGSLDTDLDCVCDRCCTPFVQKCHLDVSAMLVTELANEEDEDNDWTFCLSGDDADLDDIMRTAFVLGQPSKILCSPDCKGLCPSCGKNLNEGPCSCTPELDPRLAVLQQLLTDKE